MRPEDGDNEGEFSPTDALNDRRRPGRKNYTNGFLIAMLRRPSQAGAAPDPHAEKASAPEYRDDDDEVDQLGAAKGLILALAFGLASWMLIGIGLWFWIDL